MMNVKEDVLSRAEACFSQWSSIDHLKKMASDSVEWEKRNPLEKRRAGEVDYEADPVPAYNLFSLSKDAMNALLKEYADKYIFGCDIVEGEKNLD